MAYAAGKHAYGLCDICGQRYKYSSLKKNWKGYMVCPQDYEPKEPQLQPKAIKGDAVALKDPRPDRTEPVEVALGSAGASVFQSIGNATGTTNMQPSSTPKPIEGQGSVGSVSIVIS